MAANLARIRIPITGSGVIGPSVMTFYSDAAATIPLTELGNFLTACKPSIPNTVTMTIPNSGDTVSDVDGKQNGSWSQGSPIPGWRASACASSGTPAHADRAA